MDVVGPYQTEEFMIQVANKVKELLSKDPAKQVWLEEVTNYLNENGECPESTWPTLLSYLSTQLEIKSKLYLIAGDDDDESYINTFLQYVFGSEESILNDDSENEEENESGNDMEIDTDPENLQADTQYSPETLILQQEKQAQRVASFLNVHQDVAFFVLQFYNWNEDAIFTQHVETPMKAFEAYGIDPEKKDQPLGLRSCGKGTCDICCDDNKELLCLQCGHPACKDCWAAHIKLNVEQALTHIKCMSFKCNATVLHRDVIELCGQKVADDYRRFLLDRQIQMNKQVKRCPNPRCDKLLTLENLGYCATVTCECGAMLCWRCGETGHAPISCENKTRWMEIADDTKISAKWLHENTKVCPGCKTRIEKNGGCNHMTCQNCGHEFCWICGHEWATHGGGFYECNRYKPETGKGKSELIKDDVDRLSHYFLRFNNHKKAVEDEKKLREVFRKRLVDNWNKIVAMIPLDNERFADHIFQVLEHARSILMWSYPHAYYMKLGSKELDLFEYQQRSVEVYVDELTDLIENFYMSSPEQFRIPCNFVEKNTEVLLKHVDDQSK